MGRLEILLEAAVLILAAAPVVRVLLKQPIRRELRSQPLVAVALLGVVAVGLSFVTWAFVHSDASRRTLVAGAAVGALLAWFRARPGYGRSRGLPPGSLGLAISLDAIDDEDFYARSQERWGPIFKMSQVHQPVICLTDLPTSLDLMRDHGDALVQSQWRFKRVFPGGYVEFMNGELHDRYRAVLGVGFDESLMADCSASFTAVIRDQLSAMALQSDDRGVDPDDFLDRIAFTCMARVVLGVPVDSPQIQVLHGLFADLNRPFDIFLPKPATVTSAYRELASVVTRLANAARVPSAAPVPGSVLSRVVNADPTRADDEIVIGNLILMVNDGRNITRGLMRWLLKSVADDARRIAQLRKLADVVPADPSGVDRLAASFAYETLRLYGSQYIYRRLARDVTLGRYRLPAGWLVRLCIGEAHRRPDRFPDPTQFDPERFSDWRPDTTEFCPFGDGRHACLGADMTVVMARLFVRESALGFDMATVTDGPARRINRHWGLWRPSVQFRVAIASRIRSGEAGSSSIQTPQAS